MPERRKVTTGDFRLGEAIVKGIIIRDGPETKTSQSGTRWIEASILVDLYDGRQRAEREPPAFVRIKAFEGTSPGAYAMLESCERRDKVSAAGVLIIHVWEKNGELRESMELIADYVLRGEVFEPLSKLLAESGGNEPDGPSYVGHEGGDDGGGAADDGQDERPWQEDPPPPDEEDDPPPF